MAKEIEIPEGYEAKIEDNKVIFVQKESEDEKIRKQLLEEIEFIIPHDDETDSEGLILPSYHARIDRYKSYLEKQKDASKAIEAVERIDKCIDDNLANAHDMKDSNPDKKYYRGWDDALGKMAGILQDVYSDKKQKEQNPVDYDHEMWKNCEANFEGGKKEVINNPEKYGLCRSAEWREEGEK